MVSFKELPVTVVLLLFTLFSIGSVQSLPEARNTTAIPTKPCAKVGFLISQGNSTTVPAQVAYDCLSSVPLHVAEAKELHRSLIPYLKWQTTLSYVRAPPLGYQMPAFDFWPAFNSIGVKLSNAAYSNEWEFGLDLLRTLNNIHDGHTRYILDVVGKVFSFGRDVTLVSVSRDGHALPLVYVHDDLYQWFNNNVSFPAAVVAINGQAVDLFLDNWMRIGWHQDLDTLYNSLFWSAAQNTNGLFGGSGYAQFFYPGPETDILFANGTRAIYRNFADVKVDANFDGVDDGESFYQKFCTGADHSTTPTATVEAISTTILNTASELPIVRTATPGYPLPVIRHPQSLIAGYYLDASPYDKLAILSISNFVLDDDESEQTNFERTSQEFIRLAKAAGKTKLILDLRGNPGGTILQALGLFMQLFPHLEPWGASRFRAFDTVNAIGQQFSSLTNAYYNGSNTTEMYFNATGREPFDYHLDFNSKGQNFTSWSDLYGPVSIPGRDNFTHLIRYNMSSSSLLSGLGINVTDANGPALRQPFKSQDIIMLHDGLCASACATFSDLLREQAGIKSVVLGGRPHHGPMQAVGGTRGMEVYGFEWIYTLIKDTWHSGTAGQQAQWNITAPDLALVNQEPLRRWARERAATVNVRDSVLPGDADGEGVPSQFLWVPADCRLWYTAEMVEDAREVWKKVGRVAWGGKGVGKGKGKGRCAVGGL